MGFWELVKDKYLGSGKVDCDKFLCELHSYVISLGHFIDTLEIKEKKNGAPLMTLDDVMEAEETLKKMVGKEAEEIKWEKVYRTYPAWEAERRVPRELLWQCDKDLIEGKLVYRCPTYIVQAIKELEEVVA